MSRRLSVLIAPIIWQMASCQSAENVPPTAPTPPSTPPPIAAPTAALKLVMDSAHLFVDAETRVYVEAFDDKGNRVHSGRAALTTSDSSVILVSPSEITVVTDSNRREIPTLTRRLTMLREGSAVLRATLDGFQDSLLIHVGPASTAFGLVVASFEIIEFRADCFIGTCPFLTYAPLLKLREPTGIASATLTGFQIEVGHHSTGWCSLGSELTFDPGVAAHLNRVDPDGWGDLLFHQLNSVPVADRPVRATLMVRDAQGGTDTVVATGKIVRNVTRPEFPTASLPLDVSNCPP